MPGVPVLGKAVQAPMFSAPKATPCDRLSQVAPSPTAAAMAKAKRYPKKTRTAQSRLMRNDRQREGGSNQLPRTAGLPSVADAALKEPVVSALRGAGGEPSMVVTLAGGMALRA